MASVVDIYNETGDFYETCSRSGLSALICHITLAKAGILKINDKINFGTKAQRLGGLAERKFQELVPSAIDANRLWKQNNPGADFCVSGLMIDVKYSSLIDGKYWKIDIGHKKPNFYCVFCEKENSVELNNCYLLLIPSCFIDAAEILHISRKGVWFTDFQVDAKDLSDILQSYPSKE